MPPHELHIPLLGNRVALGLVFQIHIAIVAFVMGIAMMAPAMELLGWRRGGERWMRLARTFGRWTIKLFAFGATWAVFALVILFGVYPRLFAVLTERFFWMLVVVLGLWFVMTTSAYLYHFTWDRLDRRRLHAGLGVTFALSTFLFISLISGLSSYQLTPTPGSFPATLFNPTWLPEILHRHLGNLSYAGLLVAGIAGLRLTFSRKTEDPAFHEWAGDIGLLVGLGVALLQPFVGWFYAWRIRAAAPGAHFHVMKGEASWLFLVQIFLFGLVLLLANGYLAISARERSPTSSRGLRFMRGSLAALAFCVLLASVPRGWPLGAMKPWKYLALAGLVVLTATNLVLYVRLRGRFVWGRAGRSSKALLALTAAATVALLVTMGVIGSTARQGWLIYGRLPPDAGQTPATREPTP